MDSFPNIENANFLKNIYSDYKPIYEDNNQELQDKFNINLPDGFVMNASQLFVSKFLYNSPYKSILLYHGLGIGKTCASVIPAERIINNENINLKKHVLVLAPASLVPEWINEITNVCNTSGYNDESEIYKNYSFITYNGKPQKLFKHLSKSVNDIKYSINNNIYIGDRVIYKNNEYIITNVIGNFTKKTYEISQVDLINISDNNEVKQVNINQIKKINNKTNNNIINPFDNKIVIIDEVHHLNIFLDNKYDFKSNKLQISLESKKLIYECLMSAINCKIILLSGTPIVRSITEIPYLINMLHGYINLYKIELSDISNYNIDNIEDVINDKLYNNNIINNFDVTYNIQNDNIIIIFDLIPFNYIIKNQVKKHIVEELIILSFFKKNKDLLEFNKTNINIQYNIIEIIKKMFNEIFENNYKNEINIYLHSTEHTKSSILPRNNEFLNKYIEYDKNDKFSQYPIGLKDIMHFSNICKGKISYDSGKSIDVNLFECNIELFLFDKQEDEYIKSRLYEKKQSSTSSNLSQLRSKSRQASLIYIPSKDSNSKDNISEFIKEDLELNDEITLFNSKIIYNTILSKIDILYNNLKNNDSIDKIKNEIINFINTNTSKLFNENLNIHINELIENEIDEDICEDFYEKLNTEMQQIQYEQNNYIHEEFDKKLEKIKMYSIKYYTLIKNLILTDINYYLFNYKTININDENNRFKKSKFIFPKGKVLIYSEFRKRGVDCIGELLNLFNHRNLQDYIDEKLSVQDNLDNIKQELQNEQKTLYYIWNPGQINHLKNHIAKLIFNSKENIYGEICRIMFITVSGSEGLSLHNVRQVHIMEPFWYKTQEEQVIGRARRYKSHDSLLKDDRNVYVYRYISKTNSEELKELSTEQYIQNKSDKMYNVVSSLNNIFKSSGVNCIFTTENIKCSNHYLLNNDDKQEKHFNYLFKYYLINNKLNITSINFIKSNEKAKLINILIEKDIDDSFLKEGNNKFILFNNKLYNYDTYVLHMNLIPIIINDEQLTLEDLNSEIIKHDNSKNEINNALYNLNESTIINIDKENNLFTIQDDIMNKITFKSIKNANLNYLNYFNIINSIYNILTEKYEPEYENIEYNYESTNDDVEYLESEIKTLNDLCQRILEEENNIDIYNTIKTSIDSKLDILIDYIKKVKNPNINFIIEYFDIFLDIDEFEDIEDIDTEQIKKDVYYLFKKILDNICPTEFNLVCLTPSDKLIKDNETDFKFEDKIYFGEVLKVTDNYITFGYVDDNIDYQEEKIYIYNNNDEDSNSKILPYKIEFITIFAFIEYLYDKFNDFLINENEKVKHLIDTNINKEFKSKCNIEKIISNLIYNNAYCRKTYYVNKLIKNYKKL